MSTREAAPIGSVDLYWIPLGAGGHFVRFNGMVYEALAALIQHRPRRDIYHSVLAIRLALGTYMVEMAPVPHGTGVSERGVVAEGPVGVRTLGTLRIFRYEVRRWRDGIVPDLSYAIASPIQVTDDAATAQGIFDSLSSMPTPVWGRDELHAGEMWSCNSAISWSLTTAGIDVGRLASPPNGRAPGWEAGRIAAAHRMGCSILTSATSTSGATD